jgi:hypothetical protein
VAFLGCAHASPTVFLRASISDDLRVVTGELVVVEGRGLRLVDALSQLETPSDDELLRRTFPVGIEEGWVRIEDGGQLAGKPRYLFHAVVPRRYGAAGMVPGRGLFMNGLWHPQPMWGDEVPVIAWDVELALPGSVYGVLNSTHGTGVLKWSGEAERLSIAAVPGGRAVDIGPGVGEAVLIERGPRRDKRAARLRDALREGWPGPGAPQLVVVDTPDHLRLARPGPGVLYLSERALRLSLGLWRFHVPAVERGMLQAGLPIADPFARDLAAAALSGAAARTRDPRELLGWASWIPEVDQLLYDGRLPYYTEVFGETWPAWRVQDDLLDVLDPRSPGTAVRQKLDARFGDDTALRIAWPLARGSSLEEATAAAGVPLAAVQAWRRLPSPQQLRVDGQRAADRSTVRVERSLPERRPPPEPITVRIREADGSERTVQWDPDETEVLELDLDGRPRSVVVDPERDVRQELGGRADDQWPNRWTATAAFFPQEVAITNRRITADASVALRQQFNSRWVFVGSVGTDPIDLLDGTLGAVRYLGPLQDRRNRPYRLFFGAGPAWLDARFRPTDAGAVALGGYLGAAWDTRTDTLFPRHGHRLSLTGTGGGLPGSALTWSSVGASARKVFDLGGRLALVTGGSGALATGEVKHRLLTAGMDGLPPQAVVGRQRVSAQAELRGQVLRFASLPLPLLWLSDVQLMAGIEATQLTSCAAGDVACPMRALGWTGGIGFVGDVLGARPTYLGLTAARAEWYRPSDLRTTRWPQVYVRLTQNL